jgi:hypothetical protein
MPEELLQGGQHASPNHCCSAQPREVTVITAQLLRKGTTSSSSATFETTGHGAATSLSRCANIRIENVERSSGFLKQVRIESTAGHRRRRPRPSPK